MQRRFHRGFTIIELMVVVTIIGLLTSIAIPSFEVIDLRAKQAERNVMMTSIQRAVDDYYMRENHYPEPDGETTWLYLTAANPNGTPGATKRTWRLTSVDPLDHWNRLTLAVQGAVYYTYSGTAWESPGLRQIWLEAQGDLDGDGTLDVLDKYWDYAGGQMQRVAGTTCADCSAEVRTPASGLAF